MARSKRLKYRKRWSRREDEILRESYEFMTARQIGDRLGRTFRSVAGRAQALGLLVGHNRSRDWGPRDVRAFTRMWLAHVPVREIAFQLGRTPAAVREFRSSRAEWFPPRGHRMSPEEEAALRSYAGKGFSYRQIAEFLAEAGFPRRHLSSIAAAMYARGLCSGGRRGHSPMKVSAA